MKKFICLFFARVPDLRDGCTVSVTGIVVNGQHTFDAETYGEAEHQAIKALGVLKDVIIVSMREL